MGENPWLHEAVRDVLVRIAEAHNRPIKSLLYHFVSREISQDINTNHLNHNYPTDIITFDYSRGNGIRAELFICPDVVVENAETFVQDPYLEMARVIVHGLLHLVGFDDGTTEEKQEMRCQEDSWLREFIEIKQWNTM